MEVAGELLQTAFAAALPSLADEISGVVHDGSWLSCLLFLYNHKPVFARRKPVLRKTGFGMGVF